MTAHHKLALICAQAGAIPALQIQESTPEGLLAFVAEGGVALNGAQRDYLVRLNFLLALEALAETERLRQLVLSPAPVCSTPAPGRTVLFRTNGSGDLVAVIIAVSMPEREVVDLCVFNPHVRSGAASTITIAGIAHSPVPQPGTWRWPHESISAEPSGARQPAEGCPQDRGGSREQKGEAPERVSDGAFSPVPNPETAVS